MHRLLSCFTLAILASLAAGASAAGPLRFHYPDTGAPPWLYLAPGASRPAGVVADILEGAMRAEGRSVEYVFRPREDANRTVTGQQAEGALFFSATRPASGSLLLSEPLLRMNAVLVTLKATALRYEKPADLAMKRLCTLTDEVYPPLALLDMNGSFMQRKAKTEQAQLMMLRNQDCVAAVVNGPMLHWLAARYHWNDLRSEPKPLLAETLQLGFAASEAAAVEAVNRYLRKLRASGELDAIVARHMPPAKTTAAR